MKTTYLNPSKLLLEDMSDAELARLHKAFTYKDQAADFAAKRFRQNRWYASKNGQEAFEEEYNRLKGLVSVSLLEHVGNERYTLPSGLREMLEGLGVTISGSVKYPEPKTLPWHNVPIHKLRDYQEASIEALLKARHGSIEVATGGGKANVLEALVKRLGLKTLVAAPSRSIAMQLFKQLTHSFGTKRVGLFGDGKKDSKKLITVGIVGSLTRVTPDSEHGKRFSEIEVLIVDESHTLGAKTVATVALDVAPNAPYRFFVSATQLRNDGKDMLLEGIIGPVVYRKDLPELVREGYLAEPKHFVCSVPSYSEYFNRDFLAMAEPHFYANPNLGRTAAKLANHFASQPGHQVLILLDQVTQFQYIYPHLTHEFGFAHGGTTEGSAKSLPKEFHKSDPDALVAQFNDGKLPILIGTSCISTGTDTRPVGTIIYLQGGKSEIKFRQSMGRGTRKVPGKTSFNFIDFDIEIPSLEPRDNPFKRHLRERLTYCQFPVKQIKGGL